MAKFQKKHSRSKPIVEGPITTGPEYIESALRYTAIISPPGGPPYVYFGLSLDEDEMLFLVAGWLERFRQNRSLHARRDFALKK